MIKLERKKKRNPLLSLFYKIQKLIILNPKKKLKLFLNLSWIFSRLAHEQIIKYKLQIPLNPEEDFLINLLPENANVLDIGCGVGYVIDRMIVKTKNIIGVDFNKRDIETAKQKYSTSPSIQLFCIDAFKYLEENKNKKVDVIILSHVLEHIDNPDKFLIGLAYSAEYFYIEVPDFETNHLNLFREAVNTDLIYTDADHVTEFDRKSLEKIIMNAELKVLNTEYRFGVMKYWCGKYSQ